MQDDTPHSITLTIVLARGQARQLLTNKEGALSTVTLRIPLFDSWWLDALSINRAVHEQIGLRGTLLRCLNVGRNPSTNQWTGTVLVESQDPGWALSDDLALVPFNLTPGSSDGERPVLYGGGEAAPWTRPGWFGEASDWMLAQLESLGIKVEGEIEQVRAWFLSCIMRVATSEGEYYLKAVPSAFRHEPPLTLDLSMHHPGFVPDVVAVDVERHWTLMRNVPGVKLAQHPDKALYLPRWAELLRRFAQVQIEYTSRVDDLLAMGCFDFRLERLYTDAEALFAEAPHLLEGSNGLSAEQVTLLPRLLPRLRALCDALKGSGIPPTLHHGDFHSGNILCEEDCVVLDWSGHVGVSHPFLFLSVVSEEHTYEVVLDQLVGVYLSAWSAHGLPNVLMEYARMGIGLGWLTGALGHSRQIAMAADPWEREQEQGNLEYCLKTLLRILSDGAQVA